ncbi:MAG: hypothetical protein KAW46_00230, partial [candidate division Zixibacteria bacterium]|nr:hypothetical protein [candidate division Zixibacteria bacterium]
MGSPDELVKYPCWLIICGTSATAAEASRLTARIVRIVEIRFVVSLQRDRLLFRTYRLMGTEHYYGQIYFLGGYLSIVCFRATRLSNRAAAA